MKRILTLLICILVLAGCLCVPVSAESAASSVNLMCTVNSEGDCLVHMAVNLRMEAAMDKLYFPLPLNAKNITLGGSPASTTRGTAATLVDISKLTKDYTGDLALQFEFTIPEAVQITKLNEGTSSEEWRLLLTIPLLSGFDFPVENLSFTITMPPGQMTNRPTLNSIYRQASIESDIPFKVDGSQIIGSSNTVLNDHEGVTLTMIVPESMFPTVSTYVREGNPELPYIIAFAVLALLYWILTLRTWPIFRMQTTTPPEGITAGELGCRLTLSGGDLTMMVFSWAQLGYLYIALDEKNGKILLHKRMDMGNERSKFENNIYKMLFGTRRTVDATGYTYAKLVRKVQKIVPQERSMYRRNSGNMRIFRALACISQMFCGVCVAMNMTGIMPLAILLAIILAPFGMVTAWLIQDVASRTHLRGKVPVLIGFVCLLIWILLGFLCGQIWIPLCCSLGQWAYGYLAAYGGRRSELGRHDAGQVLGLRRYVKRLPKEDIGRFLKNDPDYYFNYAPYALALGVINPYSKAFGQRKLEPCPYLITKTTGKHTAEEWGHILADVADLMDHKSRRMQVEKWFAVQVVRKEPKPRRKPKTKK